MVLLRDHRVVSKTSTSDVFREQAVLITQTDEHFDSGHWVSLWVESDPPHTWRGGSNSVRYVTSGSSANEVLHSTCGVDEVSVGAELHTENTLVVVKLQVVAHCDVNAVHFTDEVRREVTEEN